MFAYKKVGGLHHVKLGRFGFSFYWASAKPKRRAKPRVVTLEARKLPGWKLNSAGTDYIQDWIVG